MTREIQISASMSKVLVEPSHALLSTRVPSLFHTTAELSGCDRDHMVAREENIYSLGLPGKILPTSVLNHGRGVSA